MKKVISLVTLICVLCTVLGCFSVSSLALQPPPPDYCEHSTHFSTEVNTYDELFRYLADYKGETERTNCQCVRAMREIQKSAEVYIPLIDGQRADIVSAKVMPSERDNNFFWLEYILNIPYVIVDIAYLDDEMQENARNMSLLEFTEINHIWHYGWGYEGYITLGNKQVNAVFAIEKNTSTDDYYTVEVGFVVDDIFVSVRDETGGFFSEQLGKLNFEKYNFLKETAKKQNNSMFDVLSQNVTEEEKSKFGESRQYVKVYNTAYNNIWWQPICSMEGIDYIIDNTGFISECFYTFGDEANVIKLYDHRSAEQSNGEKLGDIIELTDDTVVSNNMYRFLNSEAAIDIGTEKLAVNNGWLIGIENLSEMIAYYETDKGIYVGVYSENAFNNPYIFSESDFAEYVKNFTKSDKTVDAVISTEYRDFEMYTLTEFLYLELNPAVENKPFPIVVVVVVSVIFVVVFACVIVIIVRTKKKKNAKVTVSNTEEAVE